MAKPIEGAIAKIVDDKTVIVNRGASDGVRDGMKFAIFVAGEDVKDPESGKSLGAWEVVKGHVRASHVQDKLSVCTVTTLEEPSGKKGPSRTLSGAMVDVSFVEEGAGKLNVQAGDMSGRPEVGPVTVGDKVRSTGS